ncbi:arginyltransferase [Idiomarina zobellii]|jgi:arginine-tRNA-protein transferase|uniref:Aspartate/glutamate leucyltransferase n=1 Tax=Idiomarina zobellii TaxID=86103 RepID=A0A837NF86_9GAMM|nr:arginyltransferase [Idiomarina zobellii]KPD23866.1 arginyl-tRNA-protein transferase [Idiomarina zobellii]SDF75850.1 arginine-tRNA-protein transferase [Idiomarina zobellii]
MQFGLTRESHCNYLSDKQERLIVAVPEEHQRLNPEAYEYFMANGFRRSHNDVYRPHCRLCSACESLRVIVNEFVASKNQKRIANKNKDLSLKVVLEPTEEHSRLFCEFIEQRHSDGEMYPPDPANFWRWVSCDWMTPLILEWRDNDENLLAVSVADQTPHALSAVYTFFDPAAHKRSLGTYAILQLIEYSRQQELEYLYLGYQIDACNKMNYKTRFAPYERLVGNHWKKALKSHTL